MLDFLTGVLVNADGTPVFNSTAQIYQIVLQFLIFIVNFFTMLGVAFIAFNGDALERMHKRADERRKAKERYGRDAK